MSKSRPIELDRGGGNVEVYKARGVTQAFGPGYSRVGCAAVWADNGLERVATLHACPGIAPLGFSCRLPPAEFSLLLIWTTRYGKSLFPLALASEDNATFLPLTHALGPTSRCFSSPKLCCKIITLVLRSQCNALCNSKQHVGAHGPN